MTKWQSILIDHNNHIQIIDETTAKVIDASYKFSPLEYFDDVITRTNSGYIVNTYTKDGELESTDKFENIFKYLGY